MLQRAADLDGRRGVHVRAGGRGVVGVAGAGLGGGRHAADGVRERLHGGVGGAGVPAVPSERDGGARAAGVGRRGGGVPAVSYTHLTLPTKA